MTFEKSCGALVFRYSERSDTYYLLMVRQRHGGNLSFPKGHMEEGESPIDTAKREVFEETGVKIEINDDFNASVVYSPMPGVRKRVTYFLSITEQIRTVARRGEIDEVLWVDIRCAEKILAHSNDKRIFKSALKRLEKIVGRSLLSDIDSSITESGEEKAEGADFAGIK